MIDVGEQPFVECRTAAIRRPLSERGLVTLQCTTGGQLARPTNPRQTVAVLLVAASAVWLSLAAGCSRESSSAPPGRPNILLIVPDTLRADHLGCYGYGRNTSPRIDRLSQTAVRYSRAFASSPWTVPSHASMFTGLFSFEHGARTHKGPAPAPADLIAKLALEHTTLAEVLQQVGYVTGAIVANAAYLHPKFQLNQGFGDYRVNHARSPIINEMVFSWLDANRDKPFFLFVNYMDTHRVYNTSPRPGLLPTPAVQDNGELLDELIRRTLPGQGQIPQKLVQKVIDQYDTAIANVDASIGALLDGLAAMGLHDNTLIVLTSDHGEYFGEHHLVEHSKDVYQPVLFVPLIIKVPGVRIARVDDTLVSSVDLPHMILSLLPPAVAGKCMSEFPHVPGNHPVLSENYYTRARDLYNPIWGHRFDRVRTVIYGWPYKYIRSSDDRHELYDLIKDPSEMNNLISVRPEVAQRMAGQLADFQARRRAARSVTSQTGPVEYDESMLEKLRDLGYVE